MELNLIIQKIKSYFLDKDIATVYLFGSYVKGKNRKHSDIDIGILHNKGFDMVERFDINLNYAIELEEEIGVSVDIVDLERANDFFLHQLMLNKIIVLDKNTRRRVEFEVNRRKEYFDRQRFYKLYHEQALKRLERRAGSD